MKALEVLGIIALAIGLNFLCQGIFSLISRRSRKVRESPLHPYLQRHKLGRNILLLIPGLFVYFMLFRVFGKGDHTLHLLQRFTISYLVSVMIMTGNALLLIFLDLYSTTEKHRIHPLKGLVQAMQVMLFFIGGILIVAILIDKSPTVLLTGLGASAAVLMLVFKDSILGFVAGVQLSQNNMIRIGDWIQLPDGSANGTVEEITLNTVKVRNWDNTITTIPPYTLVSTPFKNWRGMTESGGRRVDKKICLDLNSVEVYTEDMVDDIRKNIPLMKEWKGGHDAPTNSQLYRIYIGLYLRHHPAVSQSLDLIIAQREPCQFGLPIEVYFFLTDKVWKEYEEIQSDIFDHLLAMAHEFGLKLYQLPMQQ